MKELVWFLDNRDATSSPVARTIAMIKISLPFNFTVAWVFAVALVRGRNAGT